MSSSKFLSFLTRPDHLPKCQKERKILLSSSNVICQVQRQPYNEFR
jgi:hypothetical protein